MPETKATIGRLAPILTLAVGFIVAAMEFLRERGVWLDEASLGINIADRDAWGLLKPLDHGQAAPVLYLETLEAFSKLFGLSLKSLRLPSLVAYAVSAWLFLCILRQTVRNASAIVVGCALFAFNYMLLYYSGEMKQYMGDVLVTLLMLHLTLRYIGWQTDDWKELAVAGSVSFFFSNVTVVVLTACFAMLATARRHPGDGGRIRMLGSLALAWSLSAFCYYLLFVKDHAAREFMMLYWTRAGGFPPKDPTDPAFIDFVKNKLELLRNAKNIFHIGKPGWNEAMVVAPVALFVFSHLRKERHLLWILLPAPLHFLLSWARLYPFEIRLTIYLLPPTILAMTLGLDRLIQWIGLNGRLSVLAVLAVCLWQGRVFWKSQLPVRGHEVKQAALYVEERRSRGQGAWVYPNVVYHIWFHQRTGDMYGFNDAVFSRAQPDDVDACTREVLATGPELWLLFGHVSGNEDARIRKALEQHGYSVCDSLRVYKASAYLMKRTAE